MKKLPEVLHYYLPYKLQLKSSNIFMAKSKEIPLIKGSDATLTADLFADIQNKTFDSIGHFKPFLIPLSSLTPEFFTDWNIDLCDEIAIIQVGDRFLLPEGLTLSQANLCFSKHLDIFKLIESGQAIKKTI